MRNALLAALLALAAPARPQSLPYNFHKTTDAKGQDTTKIDPTSLQEDFEYLFNQVHQQKVVTSNLTVNGVVTSVSASSPLCSSGGVNPNLTFCGSLAESQVTGLVADLASKLSIATFSNYVATTTPVISQLGISTASFSASITALAASTTSLSASTAALSVRLDAVAAATTTIGTALTSLAASTTSLSASTVTLATSITAFAASTTTLSASTATLATAISSLAASTTTLSASTAALSVLITGLESSTTTLSASTVTLAGLVSTLGVSTNTLSLSTASIYAALNSTASALTNLQTSVAASTTTLFSVRASSGVNGDLKQLNGAGASVTVSTSLVVVASVTFQNNAFSVGGSSFTVGGGSATVAYLMTARAFSGDGSAVTGVTAATNANLTGPVTSVGNATSIPGPVPQAAVNLSTVTTALALKLDTSGGNAASGFTLNTSSLTITGSGIIGAEISNGIFVNSGNNGNAKSYFTTSSCYGPATFWTVSQSTVVGMAACYDNSTGYGHIGNANDAPNAGISIDGQIGKTGSLVNVAFFESDGKVGLSTGVPQSTLDVNGTAQFGSSGNFSKFTTRGDLQAPSGFTVSGSSVSISGVGGSLNIGGKLQVGTATSGAGQTIFNGGNSQATGVFYSISGSTLVGIAQWYDNTSGDAYIDQLLDNAGAGLRVRTRAANSTQINNAAMYIGNGKVGISTAIPQSALDVNGSAQFGSAGNVSTFTASGSLQGVSGFTLLNSSLSVTNVDSTADNTSIGGKTNLLVNDNSTQNGGLLFTLSNSTTQGLGLWYNNTSADGYIENRFLSGSTTGGLIFRTQTSAGGTPVQAIRIDGQGNSSFGNGAKVSTFTQTGSLYMNSGSTVGFNGAVVFSTDSSNSATTTHPIQITSSGTVRINAAGYDDVDISTAFVAAANIFQIPLIASERNGATDSFMAFDNGTMKIFRSVTSGVLTSPTYLTYTSSGSPTSPQGWVNAPSIATTVGTYANQISTGIAPFSAFAMTAQIETGATASVGSPAILPTKVVFQNINQAGTLATSMVLTSTGTLVMTTGTTPAVTDSTIKFIVLGASATIGGQLNIGWEQISNTCNTVTTCTASCSANKVVTGCGNCGAPAVGGLSVSTGGSSTATSCTCTTLVNDNITAVAYCARLGS